MKGGADKNLGFGLVALVPIACCVGLPLVAAAGLSVAVAATIGGITFGAIALGVAVALLAARARARRRSMSFTSPPERTTR